MMDVDLLVGMSRLWIKHANIPVQHRGWTKSDVRYHGYPPAAIEPIWAWRKEVTAGTVIGRTGKGLLLQGPPGQGKTTMASVLLNELAIRTPISLFRPDETKPTPLRPLYFTAFSALLRMQRRLMNLTEGDEWLRLTRINDGIFGEHGAPEWNVSVLVIDDVGKEHTTRTGWAEDVFDELLRTRFALGLPTIVTTNTPLEGDRWADAYSASMSSFAHQIFDTITVVHRHGDQRVLA